MRAFRVSETKNELLAQAYQDAMLKFEVANGFQGTVIFSIVVLVLGALSGLPSNDLTSASPVHLEQHLDSWQYLVWPLLGILAGRLIETSATSTLDAIDATLASSDAKTENRT